MYVREVSVVSTCYVSTKQSISVINITLQQNNLLSSAGISPARLPVKKNYVKKVF